MMNDFMQQNGQLSPEAFAMQHELHQNHLRAGSSSPGLSNGWAQEFNPGVETQSRMEAAFQAPKGTAFSPQDFARFQQMGNGSVRAGSPMTQQTMGSGKSGQTPSSKTRRVKNDRRKWRSSKG